MTSPWVFTDIHSRVSVCLHFMYVWVFDKSVCVCVCAKKAAPSEYMIQFHFSFRFVSHLHSFVRTTNNLNNLYRMQRGKHKQQYDAKDPPYNKIILILDGIFWYLVLKIDCFFTRLFSLSMCHATVVLRTHFFKDFQVFSEHV